MTDLPAVPPAVSEFVRTEVPPFGPPPAPETPPAAPARDPWVDLPAGHARPRTEDHALTLTITDTRDGRLSPAAARWLNERCLALWTSSSTTPFTVKLRIQHNVVDGTVALLPSITDGLRVRTHRGAKNPLPLRFYTSRLQRAGLVKPKQVIRLRATGNRLVLVGVKAAV